MNLLALETSSPVLSIALKKKGGEVIQSKISGYLQHAENLMPLVARMLAKKKISPDKIDVFLIGRGPGSFTGLRIGFATLKGFLAVKAKPCYGALSLDLIAENAILPEGSELAVCLDARREKIYRRIYRRNKNQWKTSGKPEAMSVGEVFASLPSDCFVAGDALIRYQEQFGQTAQKGKLKLLPEKFWYPKAATLIDWFEKNNLQELKKPADFVPLYFRLSEAEEKRKTYANAC